MSNEDYTVQEYVVYLVQHLIAMDDGPEFERLQAHLDATCEMLQFLHNCYELPPHEVESRN